MIRPAFTCGSAPVGWSNVMSICTEANIARRTPPALLSADLSGLTLTAGVYKAPGALGLTGALTLDAQGNPESVFVFQIGSTLTTATANDGVRDITRKA